MQPKTKKALTWIVKILNKNKIPYRIGGGFAAHVYGSKRPINDIDISFSGKYFSRIEKAVKKYVTHEYAHYANAKWDCYGLTLSFDGQEIDMTDIDTLHMSNKEGTKWFKTKEHFRLFRSIPTKVEGVKVSLIDPRDLVAYKKHLNGKHQVVDIKAVENYLAQAPQKKFKISLKRIARSIAR